MLENDLKAEYQEFLQQRNRGATRTAGLTAMLTRFDGGQTSTTSPATSRGT